MKNLLLKSKKAMHAVVHELNYYAYKVLLVFCFLTLSCDNQEEVLPVVGNTPGGNSPVIDNNAVFLSFATNGQTLPAHINKSARVVKVEVDHDVDLASLTPSFEIPSGYKVYANGKEQVSGSSKVDFTKPVTYELKDKDNQSTSWMVSTLPLSCKILVDASHDGGVWWFPQYEATGFNPSLPHQGKSFADHLREKGFEVTELGRGIELTDEMFFGYYIIIRANGFGSYTQKELEVYSRLIDRGTNLVYFTDHTLYNPVDELGEHLGLKMTGASSGRIDKFAPHEITANLEYIDYIAGSVVTNVIQNPNIEVLGWLNDGGYTDLNGNNIKDPNEPAGSPVMGIIKYPKSRIFFIGDTNGLQVRPQPFIDNLIQWMGHCFVD